MEAEYLKTFKVPTLKLVLRERNLPTIGRKVELLKRLMQADPSGKWVEDAIAMASTNIEDDEQDDSDFVEARETMERDEDDTRRRGIEEAASRNKEERLLRDTERVTQLRREVERQPVRHEREENLPLEERRMTRSERERATHHATELETLRCEREEVLRREAALARRETALLERELRMAREEIERMRLGATSIDIEMQNRSVHERSAPRHLSLNNIRDLLSEFNGDQDTFKNWENQARLLKSTYNLNEEETRVILGSKLKGKAQRWFHSKAEYLNMTADELLIEMKKIYGGEVDCLVKRKRFEPRTWKCDEPFADYYHEKIVLGNSVPICASEIVSYIVRGIPNENLRNQITLQKFKSEEELLKAMEGISLPSTSKFNYPNDGRSHQNVNKKAQATSNTQRLKQDSITERTLTRCYNCGKNGHIATRCTEPKREKGACYTCGKKDHQAKDCPNRKLPERRPNQQIASITGEAAKSDEYRRLIKYQIVNDYMNFTFDLETQIDCGSPISFIKESFIPNIVSEKMKDDSEIFMGINESKLEIIGVTRLNITVGSMSKNNIPIYIVADDTMRSQALFGRDLMREFEFKFLEPKGTIALNNTIREIMNIDMSYSQDDGLIESLRIDPLVSNSNCEKLRNLFREKYIEAERPQEPKIKMKMTLTLKDHKPFHFNPRRLSYTEKIQLENVIHSLLNKGIIRKSESEYASPIVLVQKRNGEVRLCVDYRVLNKYIIRDNFPLPVIEDQIIALQGKKYYTNLDLKDGFHQIKVDEEAIKYTAFITPSGQYEYVGMPFGLKVATARFSRFVNAVLDELIKAGNVIVYVDDFLIATESIEKHFEVLKRVLELLVENQLELRIDKCKFLTTKIDYLGYTIEGDTVTPLHSGIEAVENYPIPLNRKDVQSFIGLASYFRKFIERFSLIAAPLYNLLKKNTEFTFGTLELEAFEKIKKCLIETPVLAIYSPHHETELHTDASTIGFGAVLLQRKNDDKFHPIFYYLKRASAAESKYHSFELETLAIIYALKRFRVYLHGLKFKIITDCNALKLTLERREVNSRIERWAIELLSYDYTIEHRPGIRMKHVDAFSRVQSVLVIEANSLEMNLTVSQTKDERIQELREKLEIGESSLYEMRAGIIYKKDKDKLLFYVPTQMEHQVISKYHDEIGHVGVEKTCNSIRQNYYFPNLTQKVKDYVQNCLTCIAYAPQTGKTEARLHNIPKGNQPFTTLHIDHYGPIDKKILIKQYILVVVDGFTKFVKLYPTKRTTSKEAIVCLTEYFCNYSKPKVIVSDRGSCFTSTEFQKFIKECDIQHVLVATATPKANGQAERVNRVLGPMIGKLVDENSRKHWYKVLSDVKYAINNTTNKSTGETPSKLLFGVKQRGKSTDNIAAFLEEINVEKRDLELIRNKADENIKKTQNYNKNYFDKHHTVPHKYQEGDYVVIKNFESKPGIAKKLIPKMKGPYEVVKVLRHDRYIIRALDEIDGASRPYEGTWSAENMRPWRNDCSKYKDEYDDE